jgi:hypothetical protein
LCGDQRFAAGKRQDTRDGSMKAHRSPSVSLVSRPQGGTVFR